MSDSIIPSNYDEWHHCITVICRQELTEDFIAARIKSLNDLNDHMTFKFVQSYGDQQRLLTLKWF